MSVAVRPPAVHCNPANLRSCLLPGVKKEDIDEYDEDKHAP